ncbi:MAG: DUF6240 domain-containing protein, partial [Defluviitaleaceae bacterium]|nr:DUF6240 domain-containing protein [Defluviitaleaceae bacterium]
IYVGRYASPDGRFAGSVEPEPSDGDLDGQIKRYFADNGIEETRSSIEAARLLVKNDLPLDGGNVELAEILRNLRAHVSKEAAYALAAEAIIRDENPSGILLSELVGLSERMREAEIMLKFTNDAAARLYETDISVETGPQREALAKLYELNDEAFGKFLRVAGAADDESNAAKMGAVYERISELFPLTANAHVSVIKGEIPFTIEGVRGAVLYARALEGYGANETVPDPRRGDSFKKVSDSFAPFLSGIGIAPTAENIKAGFILSKNEMDVSWENIVKVKEIDLKINEIAETLRPEIAASMLKDGLSPLEMHADQVIAYIRQFGKDYGFGTGEKISKCIVEMDEGKKWDAETRKRAVAVYRMLYVIQKDGAASLGLAAKSGEPLTLGALMELSKYFDKARHDESVFDKAVGDAYGRLERLSWPEESIRRLLELPEKPAKPHDYVDLVIEKFADAAKPERLVELLNKLSGGEDVALEDVRRAVIPGERHTEEEYRAIIAELAVIYQASPRTLSFLLGRRIAAAPGAVREAERSKKPRFVSEALESLEDATAKKIFGALPDYGSLSRGEPASPSHVYAQILAKLDAAIADAKTSGEISAIEAAKQAVSLRYALGSKTEFRIPVQINGATADLQVLVLDRDALTGDSVRAAVLLETKSFGALRFVFEIDDDSIAVEAGAASPEAMTRLRVRGGLYERLLAEAGFAEVKINFAMLGKADEAGPEKDEPETLTVRELSEYEFVV